MRNYNNKSAILRILKIHCGPILTEESRADLKGNEKRKENDSPVEPKSLKGNEKL